MEYKRFFQRKIQARLLLNSKDLWFYSIQNFAKIMFLFVKFKLYLSFSQIQKNLVCFFAKSKGASAIPHQACLSKAYDSAA